MMKWRRILGGFLIVAGLLGFLTVADDLRELVCVGSILLSGIVLLGWRWR